MHAVLSMGRFVRIAVLGLLLAVLSVPALAAGEPAADFSDLDDPPTTRTLTAEEAAEKARAAAAPPMPARNARVYSRPPPGSDDEEAEPDAPLLPPRLVLGDARLRHGGPVTCLRFSPDGRRLLSGSADGTVRLWRVKDGTRERMWRLQGVPVRDLSFSPDGSRIVAAGDLYPSYKFVQGRTAIWRIDDGATTMTRFSDRRCIRCGSVSPDGRWWAYGMNSYYRSPTGTVEIAPTGGETVRTVALPEGEKLSAAAVSSGARWVAGARPDGRIFLWSASEWKSPRAVVGHAAAVNAMRFDREGRWLVSGSESGLVMFTPVRPGPSIRSPGESPVTCVAVRRNRVVAGTTTGKILRLDFPSGRRQPPIRVGADGITSVTLSEDAETIACGDATGRIRLFRARDGVEVTPAAARAEPFSAIAFGAGDRLAVAAGSVVRLLSAKAGVEVGRFSPSERRVRRLDFLPDGSGLFVRSERGDLSVWDSPKLECRWRSEGDGDEVAQVAFTSDSSCVAVVGAAAGGVRVLNTRTGALVRHLKIPEDGGRVRFLAQGSRLGWSGKKHLRAWGTAEWNVVADVAFDGYRGTPALLPDGRRFAVVPFDDIQICDLASGKVLAEHWVSRDPRGAPVIDSSGRYALVAGGPRWVHIAGRMPGVIIALVDLEDPEKSVRPDIEVSTAAMPGFSPGGGVFRAVVTDYASVDRELRLWRVPDGKRIGFVFSPGVNYVDVAIEPTETYVATLNSDGTVSVVDLPRIR